MSAARPLQAPPAAPPDAFARTLLAGLRARPRAVSPKWFYDAAGSVLFERITELPEYYPTRTELALLERQAQIRAIDALRGIGWEGDLARMREGDRADWDR